MKERCRDGCRTSLLIAGVVLVPAIFYTLLPPCHPYITTFFPLVVILRRLGPLGDASSYQFFLSCERGVYNSRIPLHLVCLLARFQPQYGTGN